MSNSAVNLAKLGISIAGIPNVVRSTLSLVGSGQYHAALWLQQIYVIIV